MRRQEEGVQHGAASFGEGGGIGVERLRARGVSGEEEVVEAREEESCEEEARGRRSAPAGGDCPRARALREEGSEQGRPSPVRMRVCVCVLRG